MKAIEMTGDVFPELETHLPPQDMEKLQRWYFSMCMDQNGRTHQRYFFVTKIEFEGGNFIPARVMPFLELIRRFDFDSSETQEGWFELTHKPGMEHVVL